jgi:hypothetical protein
MAEAELHAGNFDRAAAALDEAATLGQGWWRSEIARLRGDLTRAGRPVDGKDAEYWYRKAIAVAQEQKGKSLELRAAMALARFLKSTPPVRATLNAAQLPFWQICGVYCWLEMPAVSRRAALRQS